MNRFNPVRLELARRRRGLTKTTLAKQAGISLRILNAYQSGDKHPSQVTLTRISEALGLPTGFFFGRDLDEPPLDGASFRALSTLTARQRDQALGSGALAIEFADWLGQRFRLPQPDVPKLVDVKADAAAGAVRSAWGLGERPVRNVVHVLEAHGVRVFSLAEECREVDAYSFWRGDTPFVFLNTLKSAEHSRMDAAHELGHLILHWRHEIPRGREFEQEANEFGAAFLMPRSSVVASAPRSAQLDRLIDAKKYWNVAVSNLVYRMHRLGLLSDWQYRSLFIEMGRLGYRHREPAPSERETSQVLKKVFAVLREEGVSKADVAAQLSLPLEELNKIVYGLVLSPVAGEGQVSPALDPSRLSLLGTDRSSEVEVD